jgi:signal transduction histidine kinase
MLQIDKISYRYRICRYCNAEFMAHNVSMVFCSNHCGIGIPNEDQKHMFTRLFRARNATNIGGTGMDLNIVKRYVDLIKGTIDFKSILNEGSEFQLVFPTLV